MKLGNVFSNTATMLGVLAVVSCSLCTAQASDLRSVRKIYIDKLPNDLDQYLRAEFFKQMKGSIQIVIDEKDADAILTGVSEEKRHRCPNNRSLSRVAR